MNDFRGHVELGKGDLNDITNGLVACSGEVANKNEMHNYDSTVVFEIRGLIHKQTSPPAARNGFSISACHF